MPAAASHAVNTRDQLHADGFRLLARPYAALTLDPRGEGDDKAALSVMQREEWQRGEPDDRRFATVTMCRILRTEYLPQDNDIPDNVARLLPLITTVRNAGYWAGWKLVVESNGIGGGYLHLLRRRLAGHVVKLTTVNTTIDDAPHGKSGWVMPRQAGLDHLRAAMEMQTVKLDTAGQHVGLAELAKEFKSFIWKGKRPEAQEGAHDDMIMSLALGHWFLTRILPSAVKPISPADRAKQVEARKDPIRRRRSPRKLAA